MTAFWIAAGLLTALVLALLCRPLLRRRDAAGASRKALNAAIYRDQMAELERDLQGGSLSREDYAVARDELELYYQPLISVSRNCVTGMEALIRWHHPTHGLISPSRFIQLAEDAGMIHDISRWVLETGCAQLAVWLRQFPDLRLTTNLSSRDFDESDLADTVSRALSSNGLAAASLELEITENLLLEKWALGPQEKDMVIMQPQVF